MLTKLALTVALLILITSSSFGQFQLTITGKIIDAETGEPLPYVSISIISKSINTISNENGEFVLKAPGTSIRDSMLISHIGYRRLVLALQSNDQNMLIKLNREINQLAPVTVKAISGLSLIKEAITKIPNNYPSSPYLAKGFYRLTGYKEKRVVHMSEAVFDIYNDSYARKKKQVKLVKARFDKDLTAFNGNDEFNFGSSAEDILDNDIVSNLNETDILNKQHIRLYDFTYKGIINYNRVDAYQITFDQKDGIKKSLKQGTIILDAESLAFLEFRFRLSPKGIKYWDIGFAKRMILNLARIKIDLLQDSSTISYRQFGNKYYLNHVQGLSLWHITGGRDRFELNPFRLKINYLIAGIDTNNVSPFEKNELMKGGSFVEKGAASATRLSADPFWEEYNTIYPDFNVDSVAKIIHQNNQSLHLKDQIEKRLSKYQKDKAVYLDSLFTSYHQLDQFNGAALIEYDGKIIYQKAFGFANSEKKTLNDNQTQFRIGSASKQFTAMLIMQLVKEGKMNVNDAIGKFLPAYIHRDVTIRQLLTHQSGIPNYTDNIEYLAKTMVKEYSLNELVTLFCSDSLEFTPGTSFHYSNSGYVILALLLEKITGQNYGELLASKIFEPLGMKNSFFGSHSPLSTNMATGYVNNEPELPYPVENIAGAGAITSTLDDLLRWNHALSSNTLLSKDEMNEIFTPGVEWKEWGAGYGYGWMIDRLQFSVSNKHVIQYHPGTEPGFYTMIVRQPDKGIVIILLNNKGEFPRFDMTDLILQVLN